MSNLKKLVEELELQINELNRLKNDAKLPSVQTFLQNEINRLAVAKQNNEKQLAEIPSGENKAKAEQGIVTVSNYMWDQTNDYVKIYIELDKNDKIEQSDISLQFPSDTKIVCIFGKYRFTLGNLCKALDEKKSKAVLTKSNRLIITLFKQKSENWSSLQKIETKQYDDLKNDIDSNADPEMNLMKLMKKMYDEGDDEMKKTIAKSWYESQNKKGSF